MPRIILLTLLTLLLTSCVNTENVTAFADSVAVVTDASTKIIEADRQTCANINATLNEVAEIRDKSLGTVDCVQLGKVLDVITQINHVLRDYGKALRSLSSNNVVAYDSDVQGLKSALDELPEGKRPSPEKIDAVTKFAGWVVSLATESDRQRAINEAMVGKDGAMRKNFTTTVNVLRSLAANYDQLLQSGAIITKTSMKMIDREFGKKEPVAVAEMKVRLSNSTYVSKDRKAALDQYVASLDAMSKAFDAATKNPNAKELLPEVRAFAKQARDVYRTTEKAFH